MTEPRLDALMEQFPRAEEGVLDLPAGKCGGVGREIADDRAGSAVQAGIRVETAIFANLA